MQLGKRYVQDVPVDWGVAADKKSEDLVRHAPEGATLKEKAKAAARERHRQREADEQSAATADAGIETRKDEEQG